MTQLVEITFGLADPELEDNERLAFAQKLLPQLRDLDEVEKADRTKDLNVDAGTKAGLATLVGFLTAQVNLANIKAVLVWIGEHLPKDKPIKFKVKVGDNEVEAEVKSIKDLAALEASIEKIVGTLKAE